MKSHAITNDTMHQAYTYLAQYYDLLMPERWYSGWVRFASLQIKRSGINPSLIVDLACGTGRLTTKLNRIAPTIGIDNSSAMLRVAQHNYPNIRFYKGTLTAFKLPRQQKADIITCAFDSLNYLPTNKDFFAALSYCVSRLSLGGLLMFDINGERAFAVQGKETNCRTYIFGNDQLVWKNTFYPKVWKTEFEIHTKNVHGRPIIHREQHSERYFSPQLITKMLKRLDVRIIGTYRDTAMHRVIAKNKRYFFVVQKIHK